MSVQIKLRRDTAANWVIVNPVLGQGEPGLETDTLKLKYGDGVTHWNQLTYPTVYATPTPAAALTGATLPANILNSSLTKIGTLTDLTVTNAIDADILGNAATATQADTATVAVNATNAINASIASGLAGGAANQLVYQTGIGNIGYVVIPALAGTYLTWNGATFSWATVPPPDAGDLVGTALASTITDSSLTSVGTLTGLTVSTQINGSITGSAGSVDALDITGTTLPNGITTATGLTSIGTLTNLAVTNTITGSVSGSAGSVAAANITGSTLASNVTGSSLTSVGTLASLTTSGNVIVGGDLTVNGTTTTVNSTTLSVDDKNIELGSVTTPTDTTANGGGITLKGTTDKTLNWVSSNTAWTSSENFNIASGKEYYVNGTSVLSSNTLGSGVTASSLTSVGTLTGLTISTLTGLLKGTSGAVSAATSGTDYAPGTSSLTTGIVKSTTTTGALTIAAGSDINSTFGSQTQNYVYAAPGTGGAGNPTFRALVAADIPSSLSSTTILSGSLTFSGNISAAAWTTSGIRHVSVAATLTDTTSTGTVANAYTNNFGGNTIAATNTGVTYTNYGTAYFNTPTAGTNVTITNAYSLITAGNVLLGGDIIGTATQNIFNTTSSTINAFGAATSATIGYTGTGASSTINISSAALSSSFTKTINIGTSGTTGSTTTITMGSSIGSTTTINGTVSVANGTLTKTNTNSTTDADATVDASLYEYYAYVQSASTTTRSINISNLTAGKKIVLYLRNTNAGSKIINILASATASGFAAVNMSKGDAGGTSIQNVTLVASTGTAVVTVFNANGTFCGGVM